MNAYFLATFAFLLLTILWAAALILLWATRPIASPLLLVRALACVGAVIICALAGLATLNDASADAPTWRVIWGIAGLAAAAAAAYQTKVLMQSREFNLRGRGMDDRRRRRR